MWHVCERDSRDREGDTERHVKRDRERYARVPSPRRTRGGQRLISGLSCNKIAVAYFLRRVLPLTLKHADLARLAGPAARRIVCCLHLPLPALGCRCVLLCLAFMQMLATDGFSFVQLALYP